MEFAVNRNTSLVLQDNYDNQNKNRFSVGLRMSFGGSDASKDTIQYRMTAPIIRHIARQSYGEAEPTRQSFESAGTTFNRFENVWFFSPTGTYPPGLATTYAHCTAEHPCLTIDTATAEKIGVLSPGAYLFFETGGYLIPANSPRWVNLQDGQSLWGRDIGWLTPASGDARPELLGGVFWGDVSGTGNALNANGFMTDMRVTNQNQPIPQAVNGLDGVSVLGVGSTGSLTIQNSDVRVSNSVNNVSADGVFGRTNVNILNSYIEARNTGHAMGNNSADAIGVGLIPPEGASATTSLIIRHSEIQAHASGNAQSTAIGEESSASALAVFVDFGEGINDIHSTIDIQDSNIMAQTTGNANTNLDGVFANADAKALEVSFVDGNFNDSSVMITNSSLIAQTSGDAPGARSDAIASAVDVFGTVTINSSLIHASTSGDASGLVSRADAVAVDALGEVSINNSRISASTSGNASGELSRADATGVEAGVAATINGADIHVSTSGNASGELSRADATGVEADEVLIALSSVTAMTSGNASNGGSVNATGVEINIPFIPIPELVSDKHNATLAIFDHDMGHVTIRSSTITATTQGAAEVDSSADARGIEANEVTFTGDGASRVTAISDAGDATAIASEMPVKNNSNPPSQCSTDGVNYHDC